MKILAIDPGYERSATLVYYSEMRVIRKPMIWPNPELLDALRTKMLPGPEERPVCVVEMMACYGMPVGVEVLETCVWIGRLTEQWRVRVGTEAQKLYRKDVKMHLCHSVKATDANIRAALLDRFGPGKDKAVGTKKQPGPLYGIKKDLWAALAVAVTYADLHGEAQR